MTAPLVVCSRLYVPLFLYLIRTPVTILAWRSITDKSSHSIFWHSIIAATTGLPPTSISAITSNFESSSTELNSPRSARYYYALSSYRKQIWSTSLATHAKLIGCHRFRTWSKTKNNNIFNKKTTSLSSTIIGCAETGRVEATRYTDLGFGSGGGIASSKAPNAWISISSSYSLV